MIEHINTREKRMIVLAILVVSLGVVYKYLAEPYWNKWNTTKTQISQMKTKLARAKQLNPNTASELSTQTAIKNQTTTIASLLKNMESWSTEAGVTINGIRPGSIQNKGTVSEFYFDVEIGGDLSSLCKLVDEIENPMNNVRINKIRITKPKAVVKDISAVITVSTLGWPETIPAKKKTITKDSNEL